MLSLNTILITLTLAYISYTGYQFLLIFYPVQCSGDAGNCIRPAFNPDAAFSFELYGKPTNVLGAKLEFLFSEKNVKLNQAFDRTFSIPLPIQVVKNASNYEVTAFLFPAHTTARAEEAVQSSAVLTLLRVPGLKPKHLLSVGLEEGEEEEERRRREKSESASKSTSAAAKPWVHWRSVVSFSVLSDAFVFDRSAFPMELNHIVRLSSHNTYLPIFTTNNLKFKESDVTLVNSSDRKALLTIHYEPVPVGQLRLWQILDVSISSLKSLGFKDSDVDDVKGIFSDTNFYLLLLTIGVSVFHLLFDFLAFKNDVSFWRKVDTNVGISSTSVAWRCFSGCVVLLYLAEERTSLLVIVPAAVQIVIEFWKFSKVTKLTVSLRHGFSRGAASEGEKETGELDQQGTRYLFVILLPLCIGATGYSLVYVQHRSWYAWTVHSLANCVYAFGFLFMTPQLFINYKLKSVAHLPWKSLTYKAFNTFIDDIFAFIIRMPTAHRLACFRDDIIFVVYMYQRWLYPVDKSRTNEFGQRFTEQQQQQQAAVATADEKKVQ